MAAKREPDSRPAFSFLVCPDSEALRQRICELAEKFPCKTGAWKKITFWGDEEPDSGFWSQLRQGSLVPENRLIVARWAHNWNAQVWKAVSNVLAHCPGFAWPIFCLEGPLDKGKFKIPAHISKTACMAHAEKMGWVWYQRGVADMPDALMFKYVKDNADRLGLRMDSETLSLFCANVMPNAAAIANELQKLSLMCPGGDVTPEMISTGGGNLESNAFACLKRIEAGDLAGAWREISRDRGGALLFFLVALMAREFRLFWQLKTGCQLTAPLPPGKRELAQRLGLEEISQGFSALADAEWQVKSGRLSTEEAQEVLVAELAMLFAKAGNASSA